MAAAITSTCKLIRDIYTRFDILRSIYMEDDDKDVMAALFDRANNATISFLENYLYFDKVEFVTPLANILGMLNVLIEDHDIEYITPKKQYLSNQYYLRSIYDMNDPISLLIVGNPMQNILSHAYYAYKISNAEELSDDIFT
jgi:hypothetical protein